MKNGDFTKRKFLDFPLTRQHKKCAELLRISYENSLKKQPIDEEIGAYHRLASWMEYSKLNNNLPQTIADRFHEHASLAFIQYKEHNLLPYIRQDDKQAGEKSWGFSIYLDNIRSAHNVGSILRTVEAFGLGNVHFSEKTPFANHKQVQDAAMGTVDWVECFENADLTKLPRPIIALETSENAMSVYDYIFPENFTLVVGNEEYGCSEKTLQAADIILEIPLRGRKNSLNVANAFAIAAGEISRQKTLPGEFESEGDCCCE